MTPRTKLGIGDAALQAVVAVVLLGILEPVEAAEVWLEQHRHLLGPHGHRCLTDALPQLPRGAAAKHGDRRGRVQLLMVACPKGCDVEGVAGELHRMGRAASSSPSRADAEETRSATAAFFPLSLGGSLVVVVVVVEAR